jgi:hypothetical protein
MRLNKWVPAIAMVIVSIAALQANDNKSRFTPPKLDEMDVRTAVEKVTVGIEAYTDTEMQKPVFPGGKKTPYEYGVLPVFVQLRNDRSTPLDLRQVRFEYQVQGVPSIEDTPPDEASFAAGGPRQPRTYNPIPLPRRKQKPLLDARVLTERAFPRVVLPPGETTSGFVYFQTAHQPAAQLYVTGWSDLSSKKEIFYLELPFQKGVR